MNSRTIRTIAAAGLFTVTCFTGLLTWKTRSASIAFEARHAPKQRQLASVTSSKSAPMAMAQISHAAQPVISLDEVMVNLPSSKKATIYTLGLKLELELFEDEGKTLVEKRQAGIRHTIIEASYEQNVEKLGTLGGKLYFKETLVSRLNSFLKDAVIRDIHFSQFLIQ